jgi:Abhydrolase family/Concanavalin A-like lectin/glucanases superfamily
MRHLSFACIAHDRSRLRIDRWLRFAVVKMVANLSAFVILVIAANAEIVSGDAVQWLDFERGDAGMRLENGARWNEKSRALEFMDAAQFAEQKFSQKLDGLAACSIGGWFFPRRAGEQAWLCRGVPEVGENGERFFRRAEDWVKVLLGTDQRGFLLGCVNGNSRMPFPLVTLDEPGINEWHQIVVVKDARGVQRFYRNGTLVFSDENSVWSGQAHAFLDVAKGEPLRLAMPHGGLIGEAWIFSRELAADEIRRDWEAKRARYHPSHPASLVRLREMNAHNAAGLWREEPSATNWAAERARIEGAVRELIGAMPASVEPLDSRDHGTPIDCGGYERRKVSFVVQPGDRMTAWLLVPKSPGKRAAVICMYGTTGGAGKDTTVGLSGGKPSSPSERNRAFALDFAEAGFVVLAPDFLRDGERTPTNGRPYDTVDFYEGFPGWSCVGKDVWDTQRAVDYLQTPPFVAADRIGMCGHSYGGHTTIFAALEPRIACVFASGPVSDFIHHGMHWAVPKGGGASQSLPQLRPYLIEGRRPPVSFYEWTALIAPRPLWVQQAAGERRPMEEENHAAVSQVYRALGATGHVKYMWQAGDHDFPPEARSAAVEWMKHWLR